MEVIILGSGTSQGVPMIGCDCAVCTSTDPRNKRSRTSIHVVMDGLHVQVDAAPEFRLQCLREGIGKLDLFLLTHGHADHIAGMDDLRRFCDLAGGQGLNVWSTDEGVSRVTAMYPYAILERPVVRGYPAFKLAVMPPRLDFPQGSIQAFLLPHGPISVLGLVFSEASSGKRFAYYTDCKRITPDAMEAVKGADALVVDGLRPEVHPSHMNFEEAIAACQQIGAGRSWLTHLTHFTDHAAFEATLPPGIKLAYDGLRFEV
jgi:phosphoribosyl 1,2-cyclic phosphate phosphodiesterase